MKEIPLRNKHGEIVAYTKVDDEDYDHLMQWKWHKYPQKNTTYVGRNQEGWDGKSVRKKIKMHRYLMGITDPNIKVDHHNHDATDNQKHNLRVGTSGNNNANRKPYGSFKYKGVAKAGKNKLRPFIAQIVHNKKHYYLGLFKTEIEAAVAYNQKAIELHGEFACLNEV